MNFKPYLWTMSSLLLLFFYMITYSLFSRLLNKIGNKTLACTMVVVLRGPGAAAESGSKSYEATGTTL